MCIAKYSQLNPETLLSFGGTATISPELAKAIKYQRRCTLDTEQQIFREGDGFEYKVDMTKNLVTLLKGTICTADNTGFVNIKSAPMKGCSVVEVVKFNDAPAKTSASGKLFSDLRSLAEITGLIF